MSVKKSHAFVMRIGSTNMVEFYEYGHLKQEPQAQMYYPVFFKVFGIPLTPGQMYSIRAKATAKPVQEVHRGT